MKVAFKQFFINRFFSVGSLVGLASLMWFIFAENFAHFTTLLVTCGFICILFARLRWKNLIGKPIGYFWIGMSFIAGAFSVFSAMSLFPSITTMNGVFTLALLVLMALTFLLRIVPAVKMHTWGIIVLAVFLAANAPGWLMIERQFWVFSIQLTPEIATALTIVAIILGCLILYFTLHWLSESSGVISKTLLSTPLLISLGFTSVVWGIILGVTQCLL
jgi:hypothetical protein